MATRAETIDSLRDALAASRRPSRVDLAVSAIGVLVYSFVIWLLAFSLAPIVIGWSPTVVASGSMSPLVREGDVVLIADHSGTGLGPGTVIVFQTDNAVSPVMHRIASVEPDGTYRTRGDANAAIDSTPVRPDEVHGVARLLVPYAGLPAHWLRTSDWLPLAGFVLAVALAAWMAHRRPYRARAPAAVRFRRWATVGSASMLVLAATAATAFAASGDSSDVESISVGRCHTCAVTDTGAAYCWGDENLIGDGSTFDRTSPVSVDGVGTPTRR